MNETAYLSKGLPKISLPVSICSFNFAEDFR